MDPGKSEYYEFLDLSDVDENERQHLKQTLFSQSTPEFLQLPWTNNHFVSEEWQKEPYDETEHVANGPLELVVAGNGGLVRQGTAAVAAHLPAVTMYAMAPSSGYQHPQNVFVSSVSAMNVHGYVASHYVPPHYAMPEPQDIANRATVPHRGRARGRGSKRSDSAIETTSAPSFGQQFVPIHPYYYTQPVGSPMQHPNAQHATGSPLYIAPVYTPMYGAYHPHGQYYPAPNPPHVNELPPELAMDQPIYHQQTSEEDYDSSQDNVVNTTVIVNSNMDPLNCDLQPTENTNPGYVNTNSAIIEVQETVHVPVVSSSAETVKTEPTTKIGVIINNNIHKVEEATETFSDTNKNSILPVEPPLTVNNTAQPEPEVTVDNKQEAETVPAVTLGKSWASLFNKSSSPASTQIVAQPNFESVKPTSGQKHLALAPPSKPEEKQNKYEIKPAISNLSVYSNDPISHRIGEFLSKYTLDNRTVSLQPRGLTNRSNYCYINSILQALLACPPFYNLLKALPHQPRKNSNAKSPTPIIDSMVEFVNEFTPLSAESRLNRKEKGQRKDIDLNWGIAFEPTRIYKILNGIRTDTFIIEGRQEDAEEFFGCLLNGLNDEMLELTKLIENHQNLSNGDIATNGESHDPDEVEWTVMGPKNKGSITRKADFGRTPISDIFRGQLRSRVHRTGDQVTDNVQPFFTLQLDIEKSSSVYEALEQLVNKDKIEGVTCSRTNQQVEAWQQVTIEELPLVLVLHLKCFNYKLDVCSKIIKALEFPIDLKIDSKLLSSKAKYTVKQKQYKLFAVVYHDGKEATKGHYLTDAYHVGYGGWVRYDDATVKTVQENHVLHPNAARVPYLLFYRRCDTIGIQLQQQQQQNSSKRD